MPTRRWDLPRCGWRWWRGLAKASGAEGMVLGQALDIAAETAAVPLTLDQITALQAGKTGRADRLVGDGGRGDCGGGHGTLARLCRRRWVWRFRLPMTFWM